MILTAARTGEVIGALLAEIKDRVWTVPAGRMKGSKEHRVPLSAPTVAIVDKMSNEHEGKFLFPGGKHDRPLSNVAMLALLERMGRSDLTAHGFRSTFRNCAAETTNHPSEVVEMALASVIDNKVEAAYRRGDLFEKRRVLMLEWAKFCAQNERGNRRVVSFNRHG